LNNNILIAYIHYDGCKFYYIYNKCNIIIRYFEKKNFDDYILNIDINKLNGKIIIKELVEKVFHPTRLLNISKQYNIGFIDLIDIYS
jgi:hypothetical protein